MRFFQKKNGTVTIFLVIILVPVIVVTSIFVDVSRVRLAQAVIDSAGDLALNTVLSQYDTELNEFYGLIASCQNIEEFYQTAGDYYETALKSANLEDEEERGAIVRQLESMLRGEQDTVDLLKIVLDEDEAVTFSKVENGDLANPAVVKKEIVEFMKYRSPINATVGLVKKLTESKKALEDSEKDANLIDKREEYYEAENEVLKTALEAYKAFKKYEEKGVDESYVESLKRDTEEFPDTYRQLDKKLVRDLYNTQGLSVFEKPEIVTNPALTHPYDSSRKAEADEIGEAMERYAQSVKNFVDAKRSLENALDRIPDYGSNVYDIQYWRYAADILKQNQVYSNYTKAANQLCSDYAVLTNAVNYAADGAMASFYSLGEYEGAASSGEDTLESHYKALELQYTSFCNQYFNNPQDQYFVIGKKLNDISTQNMGNIDSESTSRQVAEISTRLKGYQGTLNDAIDYLNEARKQLVKLKGLKEEYQQKKEAWKNAADQTDTDLAKQDREQIAELSEEEAIMNNITGEKVDELVERIDNVKALLYRIINSIDDFKYNGTPIKDIENYSTFREKSGIDEGRITYVNSELESYVQERQGLVTQSDFQISFNNENNPAIRSVKTPTLYKWIMEHFKEYESKKEEYDENTKKYEDYKDLQDKKDEGVDTEGNSHNNNELSGEDSRPSGIYGQRVAQSAVTDGKKTESAISKIAEFTRSFCNDFGGTLEQLGVQTRDDLYSLDYIMSMFSYDTYENEGKYALCSNKDRINLTNYQEEYQKVAQNWSSTEVTFTGNKSLTNHMINGENNWSYQNEVEYILYGGSNADNKASAYSRIFLLRYALNLPAEFKCYWTARELTLITGPISAATLGVIPEPLIRLAIILILTIMETGCDLLYLKAGIPVKLVKGKEDLYINFSGEGILQSAIGAVSKDTVKKNSSEGVNVDFQYSDYLKLFLFLKLFNEDKSYWVYARTADVIQANMRHQIVKEDGYSLEKSIVYFQAESRLRVEPLMLDLKLVRSATDDRIDAIKDLDWCRIEYKAVRGY